MQWEVIGTRAGKPGKWKVEAASEDSARRKATASGVAVVHITAIGELVANPVTAVSAVVAMPEAPAPAAVPPAAPQIIYMPQPVAPQQPMYAPQQNVIVNVGQQRTGTSGLGIAALVIGIIAVLIAWVPFLGMLAIPLAVVGLLLAGIGFIISLAGRRSSVGLPIAGGIICLLSIVISVGVTALTGHAMAKAGEKIQQEAQRQQDQLRQQQADRQRRSPAEATP